MKRFFLFALIATMFVACVTDEVRDVATEVTPETFTVSFEDADSRIQLQDGKTVWTAGDLVSVFYRSNANQKWQFQGETGDRTGVIKRVSAPEHTQETSKMVVAYPYSTNYYLNHESCNLQAFLPAEQSYLKDSYGLNGNIMVSASEYKQFTLKSVCGWLKIQLTGNGEKVKSIKLKGNNGEQVAGEIYINTADATALLASEIGGSSDNTEVGGTMLEDDTILTEVTLNCGEGVELSAEPTAFYIALPPQTFEKGVKVVVETSDYRILEKSTSNSVEITRNSILPLKSIVISDFETLEEVQILRTHYEGADISIKVPERIKQQNRRIKWGITNIAMINYYGNAPIPEKLHSCDAVYPASLIKNDTILNINHHNAYRRNAKGEIGYYSFGYNTDGTLRIEECDPNDPRVEDGLASKIQYYMHFQPGEPLVLMMSEVDYADGNNKYATIDYGWGNGWYWFPYDYEGYKGAISDSSNSLPSTPLAPTNIDPNMYWHEGAWWKQIEFTLPQPQEFSNGSVDVNVSEIKTDGAKITFTPTGDTFAYFVGVFPAESSVAGGYKDILRYINNDPSLLKWLCTSELAPNIGIYKEQGTIIMNLEEIVYDIAAGMTYHIIVNAVPGKMENGERVIDTSRQNFQHIEFSLLN